jgi:hypothetical protein
MLAQTPVFGSFEEDRIIGLCWWVGMMAFFGLWYVLDRLVALWKKKKN